MTPGDSFYETLIQFEGTKYTLKDTKYLIHKVFMDYLILRREDGAFYLIRYEHIKLVKTNTKGTAVDWIVFSDNRQLPG